MSKNMMIAFGIGMGCIILALAGILFMQRGAHLEMPGQILKVRTAPIDTDTTIAMIDFRVTNNSNYPAEVRTVRAYTEDKSGNQVEGSVMADVDAQGVFNGVPTLGQKYNPSLIVRDTIPAHATWDRMVGASFPVAESQIQARKRVIVSIEEINGNTFEIVENSNVK
jgi:hypothetical protein